MGETLERKDCFGAMNCQKPETCDLYTRCLNRYVGAEIRDEMITMGVRDRVLVKPKQPFFHAGLLLKLADKRQLPIYFNAIIDCQAPQEVV